MSQSTKERKLNAKQLTFIKGVAEGLNNTEAYVRAYGCKREVAKVGACQLMKRQIIRDAVSTLKDGEATRRVLTKRRSLEILTDVAENHQEPGNTRISAVRCAADLEGWLAPTVQVSATIDLGSMLKALPDRPPGAEWSEDAIEA